PEWSELHVLYGQLLVLLNEDMDLALQHLDDALKYGPANSNAVGLQVQLLAKRGLNQEARKKMELLPADLRRKLLGSVEAEVLLATGDQEAAFKAAQEIAESQPEVAKTQLWFAKLAQQANQIEASAAAYYKAAELSPRDPDVWSQLLTLYALQNKPVELENAFREAELALDEEYLPLVTAKSFELQGRWKNAERVYLAVFEGRLDEIAVARRMADFYLIWAQADPANSKKAASFINRLLRASYEGKIPVDHPQASWARNQAARQLAVTGDYQNALRAQRLLTHGVGEDNLPVADQILLAEILATQSDPASQGKAIRLFTQLHENQRLQKNQILMFARLLRNANQWERCEDLMLDTLSKLGADTQVWSTYISMLIDRGEYSNAQSRINRLKQLDTQGNAYLPLMATLAHKQGDQATVTKTLKELLPENLGGALTPEQLQLVRKVASLAIDCGDLKLAEQLIQFYVQRTPEAAYELLRFHALHGDAAKAMAEMKSAFPNAMDQVLALATQMLRSRRPELGDQFDEDINQLVAAALRDDPDSAERLLFRAELLEIQQQYPQSAAAYDELLARKNVPERVRAAAMNNLAFLLALMGERLDDAEKLVNQAMEIIGPIDALLDTRALVRTAGKKYDLAIEDLLLAVVVNRDPLKYYHLARAQLLAGDAEAALKAWKEAQSLGIKKEKLPLIEQPGYEEFEAKIGNTDQT
ncbi:MAG: hypothetical protein KDA57_14650, partial [Planctomycetales bacterium]|nr:hypothetical protein [Planctomycetales bacterium]